MSDYISIDDFKKAEITVGEIRSAEPVEGSEKLLRLMVSFGSKLPAETGEVLEGEQASAPEPIEDVRQVVSGIAKHFPDPAVLVGKRCAFATNLEPRKLLGLESQAMILACGGGPSTLGTGEPEALYLFESAAPAGSRAR